MAFTERGGIIAALKEVAGAVMLAIKPQRPPGVDAIEQTRQAVGSGRCEQPVDVVAQEAVAVNQDLFLFCHLAETLEIFRFFKAIGEDLAAVDSACDHMVDNIGEDETRCAWHEGWSYSSQ